MRLSTLLVYPVTLLALSAQAACERPQTVATPQPDAVTPAGTGKTLRQEALGPEPEAMEEGLLGALAEFRDKFKCNSISGCASHEVLVGYGWRARPHVEQLFATAPAQSSYRARSVRVLAELRDPQALPTLLRALTDRDAEVRGYAAYGLGLLEARDHAAAVRTTEQAAQGPYEGAARVSAQWTLARWGEAGAAERFLQSIRTLSGQVMGGPGLTWALELCMRPDSPDCSPVLPLAGRHPGFTARRLAARAMALRPQPSYAASLVDLTGDPVRSIRETAEGALARLSGRDDLRGTAAWRKWCQETGCEALDPAQSSTPTGS